MPTVLHRLSRWADSAPQFPAQKIKKDGAWHEISTREYMDRVFHLALFLESKGFGDGQTICILGYNSAAWVHCDLAGMLARGKSAGIYPNATTKDIHYILNHSEGTVLAVQNKEYFKKIVTEGLELPATIRQVIVFDGDTSIHPNAIAYADAIEQGKKLSAGKSLQEYLKRIDPNAPAFLIYTSGTTGSPKGAMLSHDNLVFTSDCVTRWWKLPMGNGTMFSFLPLCHIAEKLQTVGVGISQRYTVSYCTKFELLSAELQEVQPTLLLSVPRLWEKMMEGAQSKIRASTGVKKKMATWALAVGERVAEAKYARRFPNAADLIQYEIADRLVLSKVRRAMGLGQVERAGAGAAALAAHISRWFRKIGVEVMEDYGQTESTGVICMTEPGVESAGTVGKPVPGMEVRIAEDGEVLTRGRHVFKGYLKDEAATRSTLEGGWLHTGDLGEIDDRGLVRIKGRKKEILKTSGGKMVAPLPLEERLKASPIISQVCIVGDGRKYLSAIVTLTEETLSVITTKVDSVEGIVVKDSEVVSQVNQQIAELNKTLAGFEQIKKVTVLAREFSITEGEMTPTMKMKRNVIESRYKDLIDQMYGSAQGD